MITIILLSALAIIVLGALLTFKAVGKKGQTKERMNEAANASTGRATGTDD